MEREEHATGGGGAKVEERSAIESWGNGVRATHAADASRRGLQIDARKTLFVARGTLLSLSGRQGQFQVALGTGTGFVLGFAVGLGIRRELAEAFGKVLRRLGGPALSVKRLAEGIR